MKLDAEIILAICGILGFVITIYKIVFNKGKQEKGVSDRVSVLEQNYTEIARDINVIKTNHLAHIQQDINKIQLNLVAINTTLKIRFEEKE